MSGKALIVSLHDAHPQSHAKIQEQIEFLGSFGVGKSSILIVPSFHHQGSLADKPEFCQAASGWQEAGHELVLHGYYHDRMGSPRETIATIFWTRLYTNQEAEFLDLPMEEARERITWGQEVFKKMGWKTTGFVAPAWLMPATVEKLLADMGFAYTTRLKEIIRLNPAQRVTTQSLCYSTRAAWRRVASGLWNKHLFSSLRKTNLVRLSLHPNDLTFPLPRRQISQIVRACVKAGFEPTTYGEYVTR